MPCAGGARVLACVVVEPQRNVRMFRACRHVTHIRTWAQRRARANTHLTPKAHLEEVELLALLGVLFLYQLIDQLPHIPVPVCFCLPRMDTDR